MIMERGYLKIVENQNKGFTVEAKLVNGDLWLTQSELAEIFNVYTTTIANNLRSILSTGLLNSEDVTFEYKYENNRGVECITTFYNLEAVIFLSYRLLGFSAKAFREWVMNSLSEYLKSDEEKTEEVLLFFGTDLKSSLLNRLN